jgi:hypothetical protein
MWGVISGEARNYPPQKNFTTENPREPVFIFFWSHVTIGYNISKQVNNSSTVLKNGFPDAS